MAEADRTLAMYLHLARASHARREPMVRDKLLVLAGVQAEQMGLEPISADCRHKILAHNARHIVSHWPTMAEALADDHFHTYLKQLKRRYSPEKIEHMLTSLGIELAREREAYFSDLEYAMALADAIPSDFSAVAKQKHRTETKSVAAAVRQPTVARAPSSSPWIVWGPFVVGLLGLLVAVLLLLRDLEG